MDWFCLGDVHFAQCVCSVANRWEVIAYLEHGGIGLYMLFQIVNKESLKSQVEVGNCHIPR